MKFVCFGMIIDFKRKNIEVIEWKNICTEDMVADTAADTAEVTAAAVAADTDMAAAASAAALL